MTPSPFATLRHPTGLHRPLVVFTGLMMISTVAALIGLAVDDRTLLGAPIWLKPLKFSISLVIYSITMAWLLSLPRPTGRGTRLGWWMGTVIVATSAVEMIVIIGQTIRGRASHFDVATPFDSALWSVMATSIATLWLATLVLAAGVARLRIGDRAQSSAIRGGLVIALIGLALGFLMTSPTATQMATLSAGGTVDAIGAHTVGLPDGGPGMPLTGWSTVAGDLRIPHFVGMHALQVLPILALLLGLLATRLGGRFADEQVRLGLVRTGIAGYAALVALVTWQALRGQSLVRPDLLTGAAVAAILLAVLVSGLLVLRRAPHPVPEVERGKVPA